MGAHYKPIKKIASGGMADVFLGIQLSETGFSRLCAIKQIQKDSATDESFLEMFSDEAKICQTLQHSNIVQVLDFTIMQNSCALIMEYIQGITYTALLKKAQKNKQIIPHEFAIYIALNIARGLNFTHSRTDPKTGQNLGIVHRDISPSNVLISSEGEVKITDFGIAKANQNEHKTQAGVVKGKYNYMSPEQFRGSLDVDHRTDIYSLGVILWESLTGRRLYEAKSEIELLRKVADGQPDYRLRELIPDIHQDLEAIVEKAIHFDPDQRYQSAGDLATDLQKYLAQQHPDFSDQQFIAYLHKNMAQELDKSQQIVAEALMTAEQLVQQGLDNFTEVLDHTPGKEMALTTGIGHTGSSIKKAIGHDQPLVPPSPAPQKETKNQVLKVSEEELQQASQLALSQHPQSTVSKTPVSTPNRSLKHDVSKTVPPQTWQTAHLSNSSNYRQKNKHVYRVSLRNHKKTMALLGTLLPLALIFSLLLLGWLQYILGYDVLGFLIN